MTKIEAMSAAMLEYYGSSEPEPNLWTVPACAGADKPAAREPNTCDGATVESAGGEL